MKREMYSAEHEARVAASYLDLSPFHFHDCCGSLRIVIALQHLTVFSWKTEQDRIVEYLMPEQARLLRDKLNEWYPNG